MANKVASLTGVHVLYGMAPCCVREFYTLSDTKGLTRIDEKHKVKNVGLIHLLTIE